MKTFSPKSFRVHQKSLGFTLIELLVTMAVIAIAAGLAYPSYREFSLRMSTTDNTNQLVASLNAARAEAVRRGRTTAVVAIDGDWSKGWQVLVSKSDNTIASPGTEESDCADYLEAGIPLCLQHRGAFTGGFALHAAATPSSADNKSVLFSSMGALRGGATKFDFSLCRPSADKDPSQSRRIEVSVGGTISARRDTTGAPSGACN